MKLEICCRNFISKYEKEIFFQNGFLISRILICIKIRENKTFEQIHFRRIFMMHTIHFRIWTQVDGRHCRGLHVG